MKHLKIIWEILLSIAFIYMFVVNVYTIKSVNKEIQHIRKLLSFIEVAYFNCEKYEEKD